MPRKIPRVGPDGRPVYSRPASMTPEQEAAMLSNVEQLLQSSALLLKELKREGK